MVRDKQIEMLNDRIVVMDHELRELRQYKQTLESLKKLELELDAKDNTISDQKKKIMSIEDQNQSFKEQVEQTKASLLKQEQESAKLEDEIDGLMTQNEE